MTQDLRDSFVYNGCRYSIDEDNNVWRYNESGQRPFRYVIPEENRLSLSVKLHYLKLRLCLDEVLEGGEDG